MLEISNPLAIEGLEVRATGADVIVHDTQNAQVHVLNHTAGIVLALCDGAHDSDQIAASLCARTKAPLERCLCDVRAVLETFKQLRFVR
jgi:coenzyme PQQ synthesis protein D (PqqD)